MSLNGLEQAKSVTAVNVIDAGNGAQEVAAGVRLSARSAMVPYPDALIQLAFIQLALPKDRNTAFQDLVWEIPGFV